MRFTFETTRTANTNSNTNMTEPRQPGRQAELLESARQDCRLPEPVCSLLFLQLIYNSNYAQHFLITRPSTPHTVASVATYPSPTPHRYLSLLHLQLIDPSTHTSSRWFHLTRSSSWCSRGPLFGSIFNIIIIMMIVIFARHNYRTFFNVQLIVLQSVFGAAAQCTLCAKHFNCPWHTTFLHSLHKYF